MREALLRSFAKTAQDDGKEKCSLEDDSIPVMLNEVKHLCLNHLTF